MRQANGIEVGIRSRSEEYFRRSGVLCSMYAAGASGVDWTYLLTTVLAEYFYMRRFNNKHTAHRR